MNLLYAQLLMAHMWPSQTSVSIGSINLICNYLPYQDSGIFKLEKRNTLKDSKHFLNSPSFYKLHKLFIMYSSGFHTIFNVSVCYETYSVCYMCTVQCGQTYHFLNNRETVIIRYFQSNLYAFKKNMFWRKECLF